MKKFLVVFGVCVLLAAMPATLSISTPTLKPAERIINLFSEDKPVSSPADDPPSWANGNFSGLWGLDIWGEWHIPIGWTFGYYNRNPNFGYFFAGFADFGETNASWFIKGFFFGPFMFGSIGANEYANETLFVGIGRIDNSTYHWRMMGEVGPTFFVDGTYTRF